MYCFFKRLKNAFKTKSEELLCNIRETSWSCVNPFLRLRDRIDYELTALRGAGIDECDPDARAREGLTGYFRDGHTRVDLVIVARGLNCDQRSQRIFQKYLTGAVKMGLRLEVEMGRMPQHRHLVFIKVNAPDALILRYGHIFHHARYFQCRHIDLIQRYYRCIRKAIPLVMMDNERAYLRIIRDSYPGPEVYSTLERSRVVHELLSNANFGYQPRDTINHLMNMGTVLDVYPVHDGPYFLLEGQCFCHSNARQVLFTFWTGLSNIVRMQPLHIIHEYFGEKVGLFFAFYGMYNTAMLIVAIAGIVVWLFNLIPWPYSEATKKICSFRRNPYEYRDWNNIDWSTMPPPSDYTRNIWICPNCRHYRICPHRHLYSFCNESMYIDKVETNAKLFNLPFFCFLSCLTFVSCWKRKERFLLWFWEVDVEYISNLLRSNCCGIDRHLESSFNYRLWKFIWNIVQLIICVFVAVLMLYNLLQYRYFLMQHYEIIEDLGRRKYVVTMMLGVVHMVLVGIVEQVSCLMITCIIRLEELDTYEARENAYAWRTFTVSFIFTFILIIYTAFIKGQFYTTPVQGTYLEFMGGILMENCNPLTCIDEVVVLITAIVTMRELIFKFIPYMRIFGAPSDYGLHFNYNAWPYWERERTMFTDEETERFLQRKYRQIVMQFAATTLFVGMWPLAPAVAFITSAIDLRYCARRLLVNTRRPLLRKCDGIGPWQRILLLVVFLMGLFQVLTAVVTSDAILRSYYRDLPSEPAVYDHLDFVEENNTVTDFTIINGYAHDINKQIQVGHIPLTILPEVEYRFHGRFLHRQYMKYVKIHRSYPVMCEWRTPASWPPIHETDCSFAYHLTPYRHCYFRGYIRRYADFHPSAARHHTWQPGRFGTTRTLWYLTRVWVFDEGASTLGSTWYWRWRTHLYTSLWHYTLHIYRDDYTLHGYAVNWQERFITMLKWYYAAVGLVFVLVMILILYWCWPDENAMVTEYLANERPLVTNYLVGRRRSLMDLTATGSEKKDD